jgi:hypothetical protein
MAIIATNPDGTYASKCALCGETLAEPIFATSHFIGDQSHDLYRFSDAAMHWSCYVRWPDQARFASMFFEAAVRRSETKPWPQYWNVLLRSTSALVLYGLAVSEVAIVLRKSGTDIRVARDKWQGFLNAEWREKCRPGLECDAVAELIPELGLLSLPQPSASPNGGPARPSRTSEAAEGPPSVN